MKHTVVLYIPSMILLSADKPQYNFLYFNRPQFLALAIEENRLKKITPSTNSATKNKDPLLIIQGTDFNYTENIAFKNTFQTAKAVGGVSESIKHFYHVTTVPSTDKCRTLQEKNDILLRN